MKYLRTYTAAYYGVVLSQLEIPSESPQKEGHLLGGQHRCREGEEEEVLLGRAGTQLQKMAFLQLTEAQDTLRSILYATVVCKSKSSVIIGKFRYNVN